MSKSDVGWSGRYPIISVIIRNLRDLYTIVQTWPPIVAGLQDYATSPNQCMHQVFLDKYISTSIFFSPLWKGSLTAPAPSYHFYMYQEVGTVPVTLTREFFFTASKAERKLTKYKKCIFYCYTNLVQDISWREHRLNNLCIIIIII